MDLKGFLEVGDRTFKIALFLCNFSLMLDTRLTHYINHDYLQKF
jgi:hypothetical protein